MIRSISSIGWHLTWVAGLMITWGVTSLAAAQASGSTDPRRHGTTRAELEAAVAAAEQEAASGGLNEAQRELKRLEAAAMRERLRDGDLQVGDRVALQVRGHEMLTDTFVVRSGQTLLLPDLPEIQLHGVLRSELNDHLTREIEKYIRDPQVESVPLIRVGILGPVGQPGYYALPADMLLSDAIMYAGGPTNNADMERSRVRRGRRDMVNARGFAQAINAGMTLDELNLRAGDEVLVGERSRRNWETTVRTVAAALGIIITLGWISR